MVVKLTELRRLIRIALDHNGADTQLLVEADSDTLSLNDLIDSKVELGARIATESCPLYMLEKGHLLSDEVQKRDGCGWISLPDDFLRLQVLKLSGWRAPICNVYSEGSLASEMMGSPFGGIRGSISKPKAVFSQHGECRAIDVAPFQDGWKVSVGVYVPIPKIKFGAIDISERLLDAVVYSTAGLVATSLGDIGVASIMSQMSAIAMNIKPEINNINTDG